MRNLISNSIWLALTLLTVMSLPTYAKDVRCGATLKGEAGTRLIGSAIIFNKSDLSKAQYDCFYLQEEGTTSEVITKFSWDKFPLTKKDVEKLEKKNGKWQLDFIHDSFVCGTNPNVSDRGAKTASAPVECQLISETSSPTAALADVHSLLTLKNVIKVTAIDQGNESGLVRRKPTILCIKNKQPSPCNEGEGNSHRMDSPTETIYIDNKLDHIILTDQMFQLDDPRNIKCTLSVAALKETRDPYLNIYFPNRSCTLTAGPAKN